MTRRVLALLPELADVNGDAQNAWVLARRAQWAGEDVAVTTLAAGGAPPRDRPLAVVLGSSADSMLPRVREALEPFRAVLEDWVGSSVPLLAVGTGMELLGTRILLGDGGLEGLGLLPAEAAPLAVRVADDLVVDAPEGRLAGYENHARGLRLDHGVDALGMVLRGVGDGRGVDGVRHGAILGTRMHGPVLARNPELADVMLTRGLERPFRVGSVLARAADGAADVVRRRLLAGR